MSIKSLAEEFNYQNLGEVNASDMEQDLAALSEKNEPVSHYTTPYWNYIMKVDSPESIKRLESIYGKFLLFRGLIDEKFISKLDKCVETGIIPIIKYATDKKNPRSKVVCFYTTADKEEMKNLANYLIDGGIIYFNKYGEAKDLVYKTENQTRKDIYGKEFTAEIKLSDFVSLKKDVS